MAAVTEELTLELDGAVFERWTAVEVRRSMVTEAAEFAIEAAERWEGTRAPRRIAPGAPCRVRLGGELVLTGHVDAYRPAFDGQSHRVAIAGASATADLADCSAMVPGGQFRGYRLDAIARALAAPFGIATVLAPGVDPGPPIAEVQINPGERVAELLGRLAAARGLTLWDDEAGRLVIGRAGGGARAQALVQGETLLSASAAFDVSARHSEIVVRAQRPSSDFLGAAAAAAIEARAPDGAIRRYRPLLIAGEAAMDAADAATRARWERAVRAGRGIGVEAAVQGWRQADGRLWRVNETARIRSAWLGLDRDLLVTGVAFTRSAAQGTVTRLQLQPPEALTPDPFAGRSGGGGGDGDGDAFAALDLIPIGDRT